MMRRDGVGFLSAFCRVPVPTDRAQGPCVAQRGGRAPAFGRSAGLAAAFACLGLSAAAQEVTEADCATFAAVATPLAQGFGLTLPAPVPEDGWCVFRGLSSGAGGAAMEMKADSLRLRGRELGRLAAAGMPLSLDVEVSGFFVGPRVSDPIYAWVFDVMNRRNGIDAGLSLTWDPEARRLVLARAEADFPGENAVSLGFTLDGVDLTSIAAAQATYAEATLPEARLSVQSNGLFESYVVAPMAPRFLTAGGDIDAEVETLKAGAVASLDELPPGVLSADAKAALTEAIGDLPAPSGTLTLTLRMADATLAAAVSKAMADGVAPDWAAALAGTEIGATWVRTEE